MSHVVFIYHNNQMNNIAILQARNKDSDVVNIIPPGN